MVPERLDVAGILALQQFRHAEPHRVGAGSLDAGAPDPRIEIAFAVTFEALVSGDDNEQAVLGRGRQTRVDIVGDQDVTRDIGDLHLQHPRADMQVARTATGMPGSERTMDTLYG